MSNVIELAQRRREHRHEFATSAFVVYDSDKLGRIIDISMNGLSFRHVERDPSPSELRALDIFLIDKDFYLEDVPIDTSSVHRTHQPSFDSIYLGRYTVRFGELTRRQKSQLDYLIRNHTIERK